MLGAGIAAISWIVAAICYDGSPLFGCSDGTKTPDIAAGHTFVAIGFCALAIGLGLSWAIVGGLRRSSRV